MMVHLTHLAVLHLAKRAPQRCSERRTSAGAFAAKWRAPQLSQLVDRLGAPGPPLRGSGSLSGFTHLEAPQEEDAEPGAQPGSETQVSVQHTSFCSKKLQNENRCHHTSSKLLANVATLSATYTQNIAWKHFDTAWLLKM
jgi:hypothetical protein